MKYPQEQFELLKKGLTILDKAIEIEAIHPCRLQYMLYQQASEGQRHNALFVDSEGTVIRGYSERSTPLIDFLNENNFPLYPQGCNDDHVETAVKKALKAIKNVT